MRKTKFGDFQIITFGFMVKAIRVFVFPSINGALYHNAMVVQLVFHQITNLAESFLFQRYVSTVVNYFDFSADFTEDEAENVTIITRRTFFDITNVQGLSIADLSRQLIAMTDSINFSNDIFCTFFKLLTQTQSIAVFLNVLSIKLLNPHLHPQQPQSNH